MDDVDDVDDDFDEMEQDDAEVAAPGYRPSLGKDLFSLLMMANGFFCLGYIVLLGTNRDPLGLGAHHWVLLSVMGLVALVYLGAS